MFRKLKSLKQEMEANERAVYSYIFNYKSVECFVAICVILDEEREKLCPNLQNALLRIRFMKSDDLDTYVDCYADEKQFLGIDATAVRHLFNIPFQPNGMGFLYYFARAFSDTIPAHITEMDEACTHAAIVTVYEHEHRDSSRTARYSLILLGKDSNNRQKYRNSYTYQLAQLKFPKLSKLFKNDKKVTFGFNDDLDNEATEEEIYRRFILNHPGYIDDKV